MDYTKYLNDFYKPLCNWLRIIKIKLTVKIVDIGTFFYLYEKSFISHKFV